MMNVVFIVPTGIGAEIGGHSGDATPAAKLIASACDKLFVHPNVVNASDINEMTENMLYVEGSILDRFLEGETGLQEVRSNRILLAVNRPVSNKTVNAVSAARATMGADISIVELDAPLRMIAEMVHGIATGDIVGLDQMVDQLQEYPFDVLVVHSPIETDDEKAIKYLIAQGGINPWGGVEARLSSLASAQLDRPVIHAPIENSNVFRGFIDIVDPRKAAELVSICYLHCCLKGAHKAPKMSKGFKAYLNQDIDFLVSPVHVFGRPHKACVKAGIPIIYVGENTTVLENEMPFGTIQVANYLEAAGVICARKAGVTLESVRRPLESTSVDFSS